MTSSQIQDLIYWIQKQAEEMDFGEISLTLKFHNGELRHIEKKLMHNEKPGPEQAGGENGKKHTRIR